MGIISLRFDVGSQCSSTWIDNNVVNLLLAKPTVFMVGFVMKFDVGYIGLDFAAACLRSAFVKAKDKRVTGPLGKKAFFAR